MQWRDRETMSMPLGRNGRTPIEIDSNTLQKNESSQGGTGVDGSAQIVEVIWRPLWEISPPRRGHGAICRGRIRSESIAPESMGR